MSSNREQETIDIDEKIHHFMARKSPIRTLSKTIAERIAPVHFRKRPTGIPYESARWSGNQIAHMH